MVARFCDNFFRDILMFVCSFFICIIFAAGAADLLCRFLFFCGDEIIEFEDVGFKFGSAGDQQSLGATPNLFL